MKASSGPRGRVRRKRGRRVRWGRGAEPRRTPSCGTSPTGAGLRLLPAGRAQAGLRRSVAADAVGGAGVLVPGVEEAASGERGRP